VGQDPSEEYFNYTSGGWIYNEKRQLDARRVVFSISELKKVVVSMVGASECLTVTKLPEGLFNRAFLLSMNDGSEVIARLPTPATGVSGPAHFVTASEVATMEFVRNLGVPVPKVLSWSSNADNPVGAEYIIMEKAQGIQLQEVWDVMPPAQKCRFLAGLVNIEAKLLSTNIQAYGALYYDGDIADAKYVCNENSLTKFCIGPSIHRLFWENKKAEMNIDRGPCT